MRKFISKSPRNVNRILAIVAGKIYFRYNRIKKPLDCPDNITTMMLNPMVIGQQHMNYGERDAR